MDEKGIKLLELMFNDGETICVSPNKYGYHSIDLSAVFSEKITLVPPKPKDGKTWEESIEYCNSSDLILVALNPIKGFRTDDNCYKYRNFLIEMDFGELKKQKEYIEKLKMPYSACVFSGGKSLHFLISLEEDLPDEKSYRYIAEWILKIASLADKNTKNPSRSIRIPGAKRGDKKQLLVDFKGKVKLEELRNWLLRYPEARPKLKEKRKPETNFDVSKISPWVKKALKHGIDTTKGRNKQWFSIAYDFALAGFSEEDTINILSEYYSEERDFKEKEWLTAINSAFNIVYKR